MILLKLATNNTFCVNVGKNIEYDSHKKGLWKNLGIDLTKNVL